MAGGGTTLKVELGGVAVVCCPHDREKRQVTTERQVIELGAAVGLIFHPKQHRIRLCSCCENLHVTVTDEAGYCSVCRGPLVHPLGGPLLEPTAGEAA